MLRKKGVLLVHAVAVSLDTDVENNILIKYCKDNRKHKPYNNWIER